MSWTEERVEVLKKLWAEGHSASQIATELGSVTRNAVIGKVHRLGLSGRATPSRPVKRPVRLTRPRTKPIEKIVVAPKPEVAAKDAQRKVEAASVAAAAALQPEPLVGGDAATILTLRDSMCKWPIGDPSDPTFAFCGRKATSGPYCAEHAKIAFQPVRKREGRKSEEVQDRKIAG